MTPIDAARHAARIIRLPVPPRPFRRPPVPASNRLMAIARARDLALRDAERSEGEGRPEKALRERGRAAEMQAALDRLMLGAGS